MQIIPDASRLGALALFRGLTPAELTRVRGLLRLVRFPAAAAVAMAEQPGEALYIVLSGTLKVHLSQPDGRDVILALLGPGEIVGELSLVDRIGRSADIVAVEPAELLWLDRASFRGLRREIPAVSENLLALLARRLRLADAQILALATLDVRERVARQLLGLAEAYGEPTAEGGMLIPLRLTQNDLAGLVGATRVRVNQALRSFQDGGGLVTDARHRITLLDPAALAAFCP